MRNQSGLAGLKGSVGRWGSFCRFPGMAGQGYLRTRRGTRDPQILVRRKRGKRRNFRFALPMPVSPKLEGKCPTWPRTRYKLMLNNTDALFLLCGQQRCLANLDYAINLEGYSTVRPWPLGPDATPSPNLNKDARVRGDQTKMDRTAKVGESAGASATGKPAPQRRGQQPPGILGKPGTRRDKRRAYGMRLLNATAHPRAAQRRPEIAQDWTG